MIKRIFIVATASGSGKNWLAEQLSKKLGIKFYDMDDLAWIKKYTLARTWEEKHKRLARICKQDEWIICGSGISYLGEVPKRAQVILVLKNHTFINTVRIIKRYFKRKINREPDSLRDVLLRVKENKINSSTSTKNYRFLESLKKKYPKKVRVLTNKEKHNFLKDLENKSSH